MKNVTNYNDKLHISQQQKIPHLDANTNNYTVGCIEGPLIPTKYTNTRLDSVCLPQLSWRDPGSYSPIQQTGPTGDDSRRKQKGQLLKGRQHSSPPFLTTARHNSSSTENNYSDSSGGHHPYLDTFQNNAANRLGVDRKFKTEVKLNLTGKGSPVEGLLPNGHRRLDEDDESESQSLRVHAILCRAAATTFDSCENGVDDVTYDGDTIECFPEQAPTIDAAAFDRQMSPGCHLTVDEERQHVGDGISKQVIVCSPITMSLTDNNPICCCLPVTVDDDESCCCGNNEEAWLSTTIRFNTDITSAAPNVPLPTPPPPRSPRVKTTGTQAGSNVELEDCRIVKDEGIQTSDVEDFKESGRSNEVKGCLVHSNDKLILSRRRPKSMVPTYHNNSLGLIDTENFDQIDYCSHRHDDRVIVPSIINDLQPIHVRKPDHMHYSLTLPPLQCVYPANQESPPVVNLVVESDNRIPNSQYPRQTLPSGNRKQDKPVEDVILVYEATPHQESSKRSPTNTKFTNESCCYLLATNQKYTPTMLSKTMLSSSSLAKCHSSASVESESLTTKTIVERCQDHYCDIVCDTTRTRLTKGSSRRRSSQSCSTCYSYSCSCGCGADGSTASSETLMERQMTTWSSGSGSSTSSSSSGVGVDSFQLPGNTGVGQGDDKLPIMAEGGGDAVLQDARCIEMIDNLLSTQPSNCLQQLFDKVSDQEKRSLLRKWIQQQVQAKNPSASCSSCSINTKRSESDDQLRKRDSTDSGDSCSCTECRQELKVGDGDRKGLAVDTGLQPDVPVASKIVASRESTPDDDSRWMNSRINSFVANQQQQKQIKQQLQQKRNLRLTKQPASTPRRLLVQHRNQFSPFASTPSNTPIVTAKKEVALKRSVSSVANRNTKLVRKSSSVSGGRQPGVVVRQNSGNAAVDRRQRLLPTTIRPDRPLVVHEASSKPPHLLKPTSQMPIESNIEPAQQPLPHSDEDQNGPANKIFERLVALSPYDDLVKSYLTRSDRRIKSAAFKNNCLVEISGPVKMTSATALSTSNAPSSSPLATGDASSRRRTYYQCRIKGVNRAKVNKCISYLKESFPNSSLT